MAEKIKSKKIKVIQVSSPIGREESQKKTLLGLGLGKINKERTLEDTASVRGMIFKVKHLVKTEEL